MHEFKKGDKVREISTGDVGTVVECVDGYSHESNLRVYWGPDLGTLFIKDELVEKFDDQLTVDTAIEFLISKGYKVTIEKS